MTIAKDNTVFEKTSFLGNNSSEFVETLYADYLSDPDKLPEQWKNFFDFNKFFFFLPFSI